MGLTPSKAENDIWMREADGAYEHVAMCVDDLITASKSPQDIIIHLEKHHNSTLGGTGPTAFHLGCDCTRQADGVLCFAPEKCAQGMIKTHVDLFGQQPEQCAPPLERGDHPGLDNAGGLDSKHVKIHQSMIGALQWAIRLGRFDIMTAVMTLSGSRADPRQGHLDRAKRVYGHLPKMRHTPIRVRAAVPDLPALSTVDYSWGRTAHAGAKELTPGDIPRPLGGPVRMVSCVDSDLCHSMLNGEAVTAILHFLGHTPFDWCPKKQATVETAACGAECSAARTCVGQIRAHRLALMCLGVPILGSSYMSGDNKSVIDSGTGLRPRLHKRHNALSCHCVREAMAAKIIRFHHIAGDMNPADILSKHWGYDPCSSWV